MLFVFCFGRIPSTAVLNPAFDSQMALTEQQRQGQDYASVSFGYARLSGFY
jgi:hypothetical protein